MKTIAECKEKNQLPNFSTRVRISDNIAPNNECGSFLTHKHLIEARRAGEKGEYIGYVPGAGGDVWLIQHEDKTIGAYSFNEVNDL